MKSKLPTVEIAMAMRLTLHPRDRRLKKAAAEPAATEPAATVPAATVPAATVPAATVPAATVPAATVPAAQPAATEPAPRGPVVQERPEARQPDGSRSLSTGHIGKRTGIGNSSSRCMSPQKDSSENGNTHIFSDTKLPCTFRGYGNTTAMALLLTNNEEAILSKLLVVRRSVGNAKRVGQRCVGQPEELRRPNEVQITRETPSGP